MIGIVTGCRGFIGSVFTARAREQGIKILAVDDFSRGLNETEGCIKWDCRQGVTHIFDEYTTYSGKVAPVDFCCHLAAGTGSLSRPYEELVELNVNMTQKVYQESVDHNVPVFVFPTTSLVEGVPGAPYVRSKQDAMDWLLKQDNPNTRTVGLQFYNVTGGYKDFSEIRKLEVHIVPIMIECFMRGKPFVINGEDYETVDGSPGRDFSNVVDVADFILHAISVQLEAPFRSGNVIKVGTGEITTAKQMIDMFNTIVFPRFGRVLEYEIGPRRAFDCGWLRCDQPYLNLVKKPTNIYHSLLEETQIILRKVYDTTL